MSEEINAAPESTNNVLVTVKGIPFVETKLVRAGEDKKGLVYPAPSKEWANASDENYEKLIDWVTQKRNINWVLGKIKAIAQAEFFDSCVKKDAAGEPTGELVEGWENIFIKAMEDIDSRGDTLKEIEAEIASLIPKLISSTISDEESRAIKNRVQVLLAMQEKKRRTRASKLVEDPEETN